QGAGRAQVHAADAGVAVGAAEQGQVQRAGLVQVVHVAPLAGQQALILLAVDAGADPALALPVADRVHRVPRTWRLLGDGSIVADVAELRGRGRCLRPRVPRLGVPVKAGVDALDVLKERDLAQPRVAIPADELQGVAIRIAEVDRHRRRAAVGR